MILAAFLFACLAAPNRPTHVRTGSKMGTIAYADGLSIIVRQDFYSLSGDAQFLVLEHECAHLQGANEVQAMYYSGARFCDSGRDANAFLKALVQLRPILPFHNPELEAAQKRGYFSACPLN